jgi:hypothetical protein
MLLLRECPPKSSVTLVTLSNEEKAVSDDRTSVTLHALKTRRLAQAIAYHPVLVHFDDITKIL